MKNQFRIGEQTLLKLDYGVSDKSNFLKYNQSGNSQFVVLSLNLSLSNSTNSNEIIEKTVWNNTKTINKVFNSTMLLNNVDDYDDIVNMRVINGKLLLKQGFSWNDVFGILLVIKTMGNQFTEKILISQIYDINNFAFNFNDSKELIDGSFWISSINFSIPNFNEDLMVSIETIMFNDIIDNGIDIGKINNYPTDISSYVPLVGEEPIPSYIQTELSLTNNQYLKIKPITTEVGKTLEKSILDYFGYINEIPTITIEHVINYGTDTIGYKSIRVSNEDFKFDEIKFGIDLSDFVNVSNEPILIFVSTEITCNNKLMKRENSLIFDYSTILTPLINNLVLSPSTVYPVNFQTVNNITNTVIETKIEKKLIPIFQRVYSELITNDVLVFENKNVYFNDIKVKSYLVIKEDGIDDKIILSKDTIDGIIYYDISTVPSITKECTFVIVDLSDKIIKRGTVIFPSLPSTTNIPTRIQNQTNSK